MVAPGDRAAEGAARTFVDDLRATGRDGISLVATKNARVGDVVLRRDATRADLVGEGYELSAGSTLVVTAPLLVPS